MKDRVVRAPASLLLAPDLTAACKVVWLATRLYPEATVSQLAILTGLSPATVRKGRARITPGLPSPGPGEARAVMPSGLVTDRRLGAQSKVLYGVLQLLPGFRAGAAQASYNRLSTLSQTNLLTTRRAFYQLAEAEWVDFSQVNQKAPLHIHLRTPTAGQGETAAARAQYRLEQAEFLGEAIMREYLTLLIDSEEYEDDAAPGFLVNPLTGERMQLDRYYPPSVAFEYNGPQHYEASERFPAAQVAKQRARDLMKQAICANREIRLVVVHAEDLSLEGMQRKLPRHLPLRELRHCDQVVDYLRRVSDRYRRAAFK